MDLAISIIVPDAAFSHPPHTGQFINSDLSTVALFSFTPSITQFNKKAICLRCVNKNHLARKEHAATLQTACSMKKYWKI
jgi:hypothetical protein